MSEEYECEQRFSSSDAVRTELEEKTKRAFFEVCFDENVGKRQFLHACRNFARTLSDIQETRIPIVIDANIDGQNSS